ncbi:MAG: hypothetical protein QM589_12080 [Thermomicrobiales bacterium]
MNRIAGVRHHGASHIVFVICDETAEPLRPGQDVTVECDGERSPARVAIGTDQLISDSATPHIAGTVIAPLETAEGDRQSREDETYRQSKAAFPPLGSRFETADRTGTVIRIDMRHLCFDVRSAGGETWTIPLGDLPHHHRNNLIADTITGRPI